MPNGYKRRHSQCEAQKGLGKSEEKEVLVVKMVLLKAEIFKSLLKKQAKLNVTSYNSSGKCKNGSDF